MIANEVLRRFAQQSPLTMMAQLGLDRALDAKWIDEMFEKESKTQYTRELLFSTTVETMSLVAMGLRPSVHAAAQSMELPVSIQALYGKLRNTETEVVRKLVSGSADRLVAVVQELTRQQAPIVEAGAWRGAAGSIVGGVRPGSGYGGGRIALGGRAFAGADVDGRSDQQRTGGGFMDSRS